MIPPVKLKKRPKRPHKLAPTPASSKTVGVSLPLHVIARLNVYADVMDCTIGSAVAVALDRYLPTLEHLLAQNDEEADGPVGWPKR